MIALAHSPKGEVPAQTYREHIRNCQRCARLNARRAAVYYVGDRAEFIADVEAAAAFHDLGKLDEANQLVLRRVSTDPLPVAHEDAGVERLRRLGRNESAVLVAGHHAGLFSWNRELKLAREGLAFRKPEVASLTAKRSEDYLVAHLENGCVTFEPIQETPLSKDGLGRRLALSCLVDADHGDTARHYGNEIVVRTVRPRWEERAAALERFVADLGRQHSARNILRRRVYEECRAAPIDPPIRSCEAAVGSGKTTAVMAHLLRVATEKRLRHIFVVLPYINILKQSVDTLRDALTLPSERGEDVVAEHHHQADFSDIGLRQLATLWRAPIIVTTAVQFFETLGGSHPARLRKLHELPGSALFLDEAHAALPGELWPQVWRWLETWTLEWGGHVVLASGSLARFWGLEEYLQPPKQEYEIPDLLSSGLRRDLNQAETRRVTIRRVEQALSCDQLIERVVGTDGPRLLIVNTVQSAAVIANRMKQLGHDVVHLSTALAPIDRNRVVDVVVQRLQQKDDHDWTLVATSCVEAGLNLSFRNGFRESARLVNLLQVTGRVAREGEYDASCVWDFRTSDAALTENPQLKVARRVLSGFFDSNRISVVSPIELATDSMRFELTAGGRKRAEKLCKAEREMEYPEVSRLCRVIDEESVTAVVSHELASKLERGVRVDRRELQQHCVQIWSSKINSLPLSRLGNLSSKYPLYVWTADYDAEFLGYMSGVLQLRDEVLIV